MKKLSLWAKFHPMYARLIIVLARVLLICIAFFLAGELSNVYFSPLLIYIFIMGLFISAMFYPARRALYSKRKIFDLVITVFGFCLFFLFANQLNHPSFSSAPVLASVHIKKPLYKNPEAEKLLKAFKAGEKTSFTKKEKRIIRQEFNYQLKKYIKAKITGDKKTADQTLLIILSCIVAVGLLYLVAMLACTLSCNGSDAAAVIVTVLGAAAVIWLLIIAIKAIKRQGQKKTD